MDNKRRKDLYCEEDQKWAKEKTEVRNICFFSPLVPSNWEKHVHISFAQLVLFSLYIFWGNSQLCFFDIIVNFIIQKLKSKHTFLKKIYKLSKTKSFLWEVYFFFWHVEVLSWEISCVNVKKKHNCEFYHSKIEK